MAGGTEETVAKVKGFWINILASQRTRVREECEREDARSSHLLFHPHEEQLF